MYKDLYGDMCR